MLVVVLLLLNIRITAWLLLDVDNGAASISVDATDATKKRVGGGGGGEDRKKERNNRQDKTKRNETKT